MDASVDGEMEARIRETGKDAWTPGWMDGYGNDGTSRWLRTCQQMAGTGMEACSEARKVHANG